MGVRCDGWIRKHVIEKRVFLKGDIVHNVGQIYARQSHPPPLPITTTAEIAKAVSLAYDYLLVIKGDFCRELFSKLLGHVWSSVVGFHEVILGRHSNLIGTAKI